MRLKLHNVLALFLLALPLAPAFADDQADTIKVFREAGESREFFKTAYGYAVFPSIGKGAAGIGGARGKGVVYAQGKPVGDATMTQLTVGFQLGGQVYSEVIFFEDKRSFDEFTGGNFEFGAQATAVAITASASAQAGSTGTAAGAGGSKKSQTTTGNYHKGMAVFTVAKGGLMYEASVGGQKFKYTPRKK